MSEEPSVIVCANTSDKNGTPGATEAKPPDNSGAPGAGKEASVGAPAGAGCKSRRSGNKEGAGGKETDASGDESINETDANTDTDTDTDTNAGASVTSTGIETNRNPKEARTNRKEGRPT